MIDMLCYRSQANGCLGYEDSFCVRKPCQGMDYLSDLETEKGMPLNLEDV